MTAWTETQVTTKLSPRPVTATVSRLTGILAATGMTVFAVIDQSEQARAAGLALRETTLVIFGRHGADTQVMDAAPLAALDLPLKILIWADGSRTNVTYYSPAAIAARYGLSNGLTANLAGIDSLTDALIARPGLRCGPRGPQGLLITGKQPTHRARSPARPVRPLRRRPRPRRSAGRSPAPAEVAPRPAPGARRRDRTGPGRPARAPRPRRCRSRGPGRAPAGDSAGPGRDHLRIRYSVPASLSASASALRLPISR